MCYHLFPTLQTYINQISVGIWICRTRNWELWVHWYDRFLALRTSWNIYRQESIDQVLQSPTFHSLLVVHSLPWRFWPPGQVLPIALTTALAFRMTGGECLGVLFSILLPFINHTRKQLWGSWMRLSAYGHMDPVGHNVVIMYDWPLPRDFASYMKQPCQRPGQKRECAINERFSTTSGSRTFAASWASAGTPNQAARLCPWDPSCPCHLCVFSCLGLQVGLGSMQQHW